MKLPVLDQVDQAHASGLDQLYLDGLVRPPVADEEAGHDTLENLRSRPEAKDPRAARLESASPLTECLDVRERLAAPAEQVLALWGETHAAPHPVEERQPELPLEIPDLTG